MLHITLTPKRPVDPNVDGLGRDHVGYDPAMSDQQLYVANHGCWVLGDHAQNERYALWSFDGEVVQAVEIDHIRYAPVDRKVIEGRILGPGDPVYDRHVGKPSPVRSRNPVRYFKSDLDRRPCECGCGGYIEGGRFIRGHDQTTLHQRVAKIGTVSEFIDWFDRNYESV